MLVNSNVVNDDARDAAHYDTHFPVNNDLEDEVAHSTGPTMRGLDASSDVNSHVKNDNTHNDVHSKVESGPIVQ